MVPLVRLGLVLLLGLSSQGCGGGGGGKDSDVEIVNVSYDPTRELHKELGQAFSEQHLKATGKRIKVTSTHGGSGAQARAVIDGLKADVVTLALAGDIEAISRKGLINPDWQSRLDDNASPYTSTIVFVVRAGNPKGIKNWPDLAQPGIKVVTPNPKTSGGARWNFLAAWGFVTVHQKKGENEAKDLLRGIFNNVNKLDTGARGSSETFVHRKVGDVFISWENEAILVAREAPEQKLEIIYPSVSILAEPPVAVVDKVVDQRGTRAEAEAFLKFLYTDEAQEIIGKNSYRPIKKDILKKFAGTLLPVQLFTLRDLPGAGTWAEAQKKFFSDGGVFDEIYTKK